MKIFFKTIFFLSLLLPAFAEAKQFRARLVEDMGTLDWNYGEVNPEIVYQMMEGLYTTDHVGRPLPVFAKRYEWKQGKTKLKVQLEKGKLWSDGKELCAQHFVDSWTRLQSKEFGSPYAHYANVLKSFKANGCYELEIEFTRPAPEALALFSHYVFFPVRLDALEKNPKIFNDGVGLPVTGPYQVSEWKKNQSLSLTRNANYEFEGLHATSVDKLDFLFIPDDGTAKTMFDKKMLDWMKDIPPLLRTPQLESSQEFKHYASLTSYYFGLNEKASALLANPAIREALGAALDREELKSVLGSEVRPASTWLTFEIFPQIRPKESKPFDFTMAKELLAAAAAAGKMDLKLRLYSKPAHKLLAEWAQGQWQKKLGVLIPIEMEDAKVYWKELTTNPAPIYLSGVTAPYNHPRAYLQEFLTSSTANWTSWSSKEFDQLVDGEKIQKAEDLLEKAGYVIPLYSKDATALIQKSWKGFWINPLGQVFLKTVH